MPPPQIFSLDGHAFGLTVSGVQIIDKVPTDLAPIRWDWPSATNNGGITFTVEDQGETALPGGAVIRFTDNVNNELLFSGPLTNVRQQRSAGPYRHADVTGTGWGLFLDNRYVVSHTMNYVGTDDARQLGVIIDFHGGPIQQTIDTINIGQLYNLDPVTVEGLTVRGLVDAFFENGFQTTTATYDPKYYVANDQQFHVWTDDADEATVVGTATSVGDGGSLLPEYLMSENGHESVKHLAAMYDSGGTATGDWVAGPVASWESGVTSTSYTDDTVGLDPSLVAVARLESLYSDVTSITFTTIEDSSFRPHMEITVDDSLLTGGVAETFYISDVSGTIDDRNVIEVSVSIGARARSIVQTVAGNL